MLLARPLPLPPGRWPRAIQSSASRQSVLLMSPGQRKKQKKQSKKKNKTAKAKERERERGKKGGGKRG